MITVKTLSYLIFFFLISIYSSSSLQYDLIVAKDGSGDCTTINDAIRNAPNSSLVSFWILIKAGDSYEYVTIPEEKSNIVFVGEGMNVTNIIGTHSDHGGYSIANSATVDILGHGFQARNLTISNFAGLILGEIAKQAVAVRTISDKSTFYNCAIRGYQDTIWLVSGRHFFRDCNIYGTVDFVFGNGTAVFQECMIYARARNTVVFTAQSRHSLGEKTGFTFHRSAFTIAPQDASSKENVTAFLGRPWGSHSTVEIIDSYIDSIVKTEGWTTMGGGNLDLVTYVEYKNTGPGAITDARVKAPGVKSPEK